LHLQFPPSLRFRMESLDCIRHSSTLSIADRSVLHEPHRTNFLRV